MQETPVKYSIFFFFFREGLFTLILTLTKMDYFIKCVCKCFQKLGDLDARINVGGWWYALYMYILMAILVIETFSRACPSGPVIA